MDEEFATKEDLELIKGNPELQRVYNAMKSGVTKKFQSFSEEKKQLSDRLSTYETTINQWEQWRPILESYMSDDGQQNNHGRHVEDDDMDDNRGRSRSRRRQSSNDGDDDDARGVNKVIDTLKSEFTKEFSTLKSELGTHRRMYDLYLQLDDIRRAHATKYPDVKFDTDKVLATALERGYNNLGDAYDNIYRGDFIKHDVESQVKQRLEEEIAKNRTQGETGSGAQPLSFKLPDDRPKSFSEASQAVLSEMKAGTLNPATTK